LGDFGEGGGGSGGEGVSDQLSDCEGLKAVPDEGMKRELRARRARPLQRGKTQEYRQECPCHRLGRKSHLMRDLTVGCGLRTVGRNVCGDRTKSGKLLSRRVGVPDGSLEMLPVWPRVRMFCTMKLTDTEGDECRM
jgi:hypothetical protein